MKNHGVIHPDLVRLLAQLGHKDEVLICDAGFPIPLGVERIDLAYRLGSPEFGDVVEAIVADIAVESIVVADESGDDLADWLKSVTDAESMQRLTHDQLKSRAERSRAVIRTGESTPFANVILIAGVAF
jgi:D-ribose pyranase